MEKLKAAYYFSPENIDRYKEIFLGEYVWEAIPRIEEYVKKITTEKGKNIVIGENTKISEKAVIEGPAIIGSDCDIRPGAFIRQNVIIGNNCEFRSEVKNSLIMDNTNASHLSYIGDSILGSNSNLGAGTILSNLKLNEKTIILEVDGKEFDTGMKKFGAIIGDEVHTGCGVITNPGTLIGRNTFVYSHAVLKGFYPAEIILKFKPNIEVVKKN